MNKLFNVLAVATTLVSTSFADEEAKLVQISASAGLPEGVDHSTKPQNYEYGVKLSYFLEGDGIVRIDKDSFDADSGWKLGSWPRVSDDGTMASFTIQKRGNYINKLDKVKVEGSLSIVIGLDSEKKTVTPVEGEKVDLGPFKIEMNTGDGNWDNYIKINGDVNKIISTKCTVDGKTLSNNGGGSSDDYKKIYFKGLEEGAEFEIKYWTNTENKTVTFKR